MFEPSGVWSDRRCRHNELGCGLRSLHVFDARCEILPHHVGHQNDVTLRFAGLDQTHCFDAREISFRRLEWRQRFSLASSVPSPEPPSEQCGENCREQCNERPPVERDENYRGPRRFRLSLSCISRKNGTNEYALISERYVFSPS